MTEQPASRHPWLEAFTADPVKGVGDLLAGYAPVHPYTRADAPDAARMLFGNLLADDPARAALPDGLLGWLNQARRTPLPAEPAVLQDRVRCVVDAFQIVTMLEVAPAAVLLRREFPRWSDWTGQMTIAPSRDAREAYLGMLAQTQIVVADHVANPDALAPLWMRLCREAGDPLPDRYLQTGLLGLRRLPEAIARGDTPWIAGLAAWALARNPSDRQFLRVWRPFRRLYPSTPAALRKQVFNVLAQKSFRDADVEPPGWWAVDPDFAKAQSRIAKVTLGPPTPDLHERLLDAIRSGMTFARLKPNLDALTAAHRTYVERSGDSYFLVRSFCNVGKQLIRRGGDDLHDGARSAQALAREALSHQPGNLFAWSLWRDALAAEGALEAARALGWEMVRRFADDPNSRVELADLLAKKLGALDEAETVIRDTIGRFPNNAFARNELAELLIAQDRAGEAQDVVAATIGDCVADAATYAILARLRAARNDVEGARQAVDTGLRLAHDIVLVGARAMLDEGKTPTLISAAYRRSPATKNATRGDPAPDDILRGGRLRALRERIDRDAAALAELKVVFEEDPTFAYGQLLAARHGLSRAAADALPPVAVAFEEALADGDRDRLEALAARAPRLEALILLARALLGDGDAARHVARLIESGDDARGDHGLRILHARLKPVLTVIRGGIEPLDAIRADAERVRQAIYDANEALSALDLIAA